LAPGSCCGLRDPEQRPRHRARCDHPPRHRHLRRLPPRGVRSRGSTLPVSLDELHELRTSLLDPRIASLRPGADNPEGHRVVRSMPVRIRRSPRSSLARPAHGVPRVWSPPELWTPAGAVVATRDTALRAAGQAIREGIVIAVQGVGGFHLMVDARSERAVRLLRERKGREDKAFAVMYPSLERVRADATLAPLEALLLTSPEAPIVLVRRASDDPPHRWRPAIHTSAFCSRRTLCIIYWPVRWGFRACGAARCHQKSTPAPPHLPHHNQARAIATPILSEQAATPARSVSRDLFLSGAMSASGATPCPPAGHEAGRQPTMDRRPSEEDRRPEW
jgi:threonylcarbamoyl-AMP synthase-like protein